MLSDKDQDMLMNKCHAALIKVKHAHHEFIMDVHGYINAKIQGDAHRIRFSFCTVVLRFCSPRGKGSRITRPLHLITWVEPCTSLTVLE